MKRMKYDPEQMEHREFLSDAGVTYTGEYIDMRIDKSSVPKGKYMYECREGVGGDWLNPATIEKRVLVDFAGTFITTDPIAFPDEKDPYIPLKIRE